MKDTIMYVVKFALLLIIGGAVVGIAMTLFGIDAPKPYLGW